MARTSTIVKTESATLSSVDRADQIREHADALVDVLKENNGEMDQKKLLVATTRKYGMYFSSLRYAVTYARHEKMLGSDASRETYYLPGHKGAMAELRDVKEVRDMRAKLVESLDASQHNDLAAAEIQGQLDLLDWFENKTSQVKL